MSTENAMPDWVQKLVEALATTIDFKGFGNVEGRYAAPDETFWGTHLLELSPGLFEVAQPNSDDEGPFSGIVNHIDLLEAQAVFDEVASLGFDVENDGSIWLTIEGKVNEQDIVVRITTEPLEDAEVHERYVVGSEH